MDSGVGNGKQGRGNCEVAKPEDSDKLLLLCSGSLPISDLCFSELDRESSPRFLNGRTINPHLSEVSAFLDVHVPKFPSLIPEHRSQTPAIVAHQIYFSEMPPFVWNKGVNPCQSWKHHTWKRRNMND